MKKINTLLLIIIFGFTTNTSIGQMSGTKWSGLIHVPGPVNAILDFRNDSLFTLSADNGVVHEIQRYMFDKNILVIQKISGDSPCGTDIGRYNVVFKNEFMYLSVVMDACDSRSKAFRADEAFTKLK